MYAKNVGILIIICFNARELVVVLCIFLEIRFKFLSRYPRELLLMDEVMTRLLISQSIL